MSTRRNDVVRCPIPGCISQLIATHPMKTEIRFDRVMQNLVDKLLPKFAQEDDELKTTIAREYGKAEPPAKRSASGSPEGTESATKRPKFGDDKLLDPTRDTWNTGQEERGIDRHAICWDQSTLTIILSYSCFVFFLLLL